MKIPLKRRIPAFIMRPITQCIIAAALAVLAWNLVPTVESPSRLFITDYAPLLSVLGALATVLALIGSLSMSHALQFAYAAIAARTQAYAQLHSRLDALDEYLRSQNSKDPIVDRTREFVWELSKLRISDFPVMDWDERISPVKEALEGERKRRAQHLWHDVVRALHRCEESINELGLISIRQILAKCILYPVVKMFVFLALLLISMGLLLVMPKVPLHLAVSTVSFFLTMTILLLAEVLWEIHRDFDERLDFIERQADHDENASDA